ncbi:MAG: hypothetical protein ACRCZF_27955 [Gemmataceae bacterium]
MTNPGSGPDRRRRTNGSGSLPPIGPRFATVPSAERGSPDGVRWHLVEQAKARIAAGYYDREDVLALAEERLFARFDDR